MMISDEPFVVFLLCNPSRIWPGTVPELPSGTTRGTAKIAQKLEGQKRSAVAPFDFLTPEFRSYFRCAKLVRKWSGTDFGTHFGKIRQGPEMLSNLFKFWSGKDEIGWFLGRRGSVWAGTCCGKSYWAQVPL